MPTGCRKLEVSPNGQLKLVANHQPPGACFIFFFFFLVSKLFCVCYYVRYVCTCPCEISPRPTDRTNAENRRLTTRALSPLTLSCSALLYLLNLLRTLLLLYRRRTDHVRTRRYAASSWTPRDRPVIRQQQQRVRSAAAATLLLLLLSSARTWPLPRARPPCSGLAGGRTCPPAGCSSTAARTTGA